MADSASVSIFKADQNLILKWMRYIQDDERYYFSKAIEIFSELSASRQAIIIRHFAEKEEQKFWLENAEDSTRYRDVLRSILFYYSGREKIGDPSKEIFKKELGSILKSRDFKMAGAASSVAEFKKELESL